MDIGYEDKMDILGIVLKDDYEYDRSVEVEPLFIADIDKEGDIVALEIIDIARRFGVTGQHIKTADIDVKIETGKHCSYIEVFFKLSNGKKSKITGSVLL